MLAPLAGAASGKFYEEIVGRIPQDDVTRAVSRARLLLLHALRSGRRISDLCAPRATAPTRRRKSCSTAIALAAGHDYSTIGTWQVSPDNRLLAYRRGYRRAAPVRDPRQGSRERRAASPIASRTRKPSIAWADDNRIAALYREGPGDAARLSRAASRARTPTRARTRCVWEQNDTTFYTDHRELEVRALSSSSPPRAPCPRSGGTRAPTIRARVPVVLPRERDHEYSGRAPRRALRDPHQLAGAELPHHGSADRGVGRPLQPGARSLPHRGDAFVHDFEVFRDFLAVAERSGGLRKIRIKPWSGRRRSG